MEGFFKWSLGLGPVVRVYRGFEERFRLDTAPTQYQLENNNNNNNMVICRP